MKKTEKIIKYLYPTEEILRKINVQRKISLRKNIGYTIIFVILNVVILILSFSLEGKFIFIFLTLLMYFILTMFVFVIYVEERKRRKLEKEQLKIVKKENKLINKKIINNRDRYYVTSSIILTTIFIISIYFSLHIFIRDLINKDYTNNIIVLFYLVFIVSSIPAIIIFVISSKIHIRNQLKIIDEYEINIEKNMEE